MGFVQSASTQYIQTVLTNYGRGLLVSGTTTGLGGLTNFVKKFGLSDIDIDYRQTSLTGHTAQLGFIPDVTGDLCDCCNGLNDGYLQSSYLCWQGCSTVTPQAKQMLVGIKKNATTPINYYDIAEVDVYLHDYFALLKLVSNLYAYDQELFWKGNSLPSATASDFETEAAQKLGLGASPNSTTIGGALKYLGKSVNEGGYGRGVFLDFWDDTLVYDPTSGAQTKENVEISFGSQIDNNNHQILAGGSYLFSQGPASTWSTPGAQNNMSPDLDFANGAYMDISQLTPNVYGNTTIQKGGVSPWTISFNHATTSGPDPGAVYKGAGPAGIGFPITDIGYMALPTYETYGQPGPTVPGSAGQAQTWDNSSGVQYPYPYWPTSNQDIIDAGGFWSNEIYFIGYSNPYQMENMFGITQPNATGNWVTPNGTSLQFEIMGDSNAPLYRAVNYYVPTLRQHIIPNSNDDTANGYYIPRPESIATQLHSNSTYDMPTVSQGPQMIYTPAVGHSPMSTLGYFGTTLEYFHLETATHTGVGTAALGGTVTVPSTSHVNYGGNDAASVYGGGVYYTWFTRKMIMNDWLLDAVGKNGSMAFPTFASVFSAKSSSNLVNIGFNAGDVDEFNISIPVTYNIHSADDPTVLPALVKVNFIYNKVAALQSLGYSGVTASYGSSLVPYYRLFDKTEVKFYGEDGDSSNISSITPATDAFQEDNGSGNKIFRKIHSTSNQVI